MARERKVFLRSFFSSFSVKAMIKSFREYFWFRFLFFLFFVSVPLFCSRRSRRKRQNDKIVRRRHVFFVLFAQLWLMFFRERFPSFVRKQFYEFSTRHLCFICAIWSMSDKFHRDAPTVYLTYKYNIFYRPSRAKDNLNGILKFYWRNGEARKNLFLNGTS